MKHDPTFMPDLQAIASKRMEYIHAQREEIIEAFIAKHGYEPDEIVQVIQNMNDGTTKYWVRLKSEEETTINHQHAPESSGDDNEMDVCMVCIITLVVLALAGYAAIIYDLWLK